MDHASGFAVVYRPRGTDLMSKACPTQQDVPFFNRCMSRAREMGLEWERALDYVIEQRKRTRTSEHRL
ncbi:MAG: hypothetical protein NVSMB62_10110 [Acidobacteriaceae bacterium]